MSNQFYDENGKLDFIELADAIMKHLTIITLNDTEEMLYYDDDYSGVYKYGAEHKIKTLAKKLTERKIKSNQIREVILDIQTKTYIDRSELNQDENLIWVKNGIYNIETNELMQHSPDYISTIQIPVFYIKDQKCEKFETFLEEVLNPKDIKIVKQIFAYPFIKGYPIQKAFMFLGGGANGKSTLLNVLTAFVGKENISNVSLQELDTNRFSSGFLYGKLLNIYDDLSDRALYNTGKFRMLTGGSTIHAEKKFQQGFPFQNEAKLIFSANKLPEVKDDTDAFFRRWIFVAFPNTFTDKEAKKELTKELTTQKELAGIFNIVIQELKELRQTLVFDSNESTEETRIKYDKMSNSLKAFVIDCIDFDNDSNITKDNFFSAYKVYCDENKLPVKTKIAVGRELPEITQTQAGQETINKKRTHIWRSLKLKCEFNIEKQEQNKDLTVEYHSLGEYDGQDA